MGNSFKDFVSKFKEMNIYQKAAGAVLAVTIPVAIVMGVNAVTEYSSSDDSSNISSIISMVSSVFSSSGSAPASSSKEPVEVFLRPSSVEEDLEVQIIDKSGNLVIGAEFKLTVTGKGNGYNKVWPVDDGFLKLTKLQSGDYTVSIAEKEGYIVPQEPIQCKVAKKVEYVKVDVSDKVLDDSQVDASKEDAGYTNSKPPQEPPVQVSDTVEYVASSSKVVKKDVQVKTNKYKPITGDGGRLKNQDGTTSDYYPILDSEGYLIGASLTPQAKAASIYSGLLSIRPFTIVSPGIGLDESSAGESSRQSSESSSRSVEESSQSSEVSSVSSSVSSQSSEESSVSSSVSSQSGEESSASSSVSSQSGEESSASSSVSSQSDEISSASSSVSSQTSSSTSISSSSAAGSSQQSQEKIELFDADGEPMLKDGKPLFMMEKVEITVTKKEDVTVYYGWQTINGKKYYFDKNGDKVTGNQIIQGITYYFDKDGVMGNRIGIDVSKYQGNINWQAVKDSGIEFAIIRVGYRGYGSGVLVEDHTFRQNIRGATAAGLKVGVYIFSQAINTQEAVEEASMCIQAVQGYNLAYPIFFDTEYSTSRKDGRADALSKSHRTTIAKAFCETVANSGYKAGVYASKSWFYGQLEYSQIAAYNIWMAHYTSATDFTYRYDIWQYTGSGSCRGIGGAVDMNIGYTVY